MASLREQAAQPMFIETDADEETLLDSRIPARSNPRISRRWMLGGLCSLLMLGTLSAWHHNAGGSLRATQVEQVQDKWTTWVRKHNAPGKAASRTDSLDVAQCAFETIVVADLIARTAIQINQATLDCPASKQGDPEYRMQCSADIFGILAATSLMANMLSGIVSQCDVFSSPDANNQQKCAGGITGLIGHLTGIVVNAEHAKIWCPGADEWEMTGFYGHYNETRMSQGYGVIVGPQYDLTKTLCILDISQLTSLFVLAGFHFTQANQACTAARKQVEAGASLAASKTNRENCANDVLLGMAQTILALGWIADATSRCAPVQYKEALCTGAITKAYGHATGLAQSAVQIDQACPAATPVAVNHRKLQEKMKNLMMINMSTAVRDPREL